MKQHSSFYFLIIFFLIIGTTVNAQKVPVKEGRCQAVADQIYFVEDGQSILDVHPGTRGYQLNILGNGANNFEVVQENFMSAVSVIPGYTNATSAKWQINFSPNMERVLCSVKMKNKCTGETTTYQLTVGVRLFNQ